MIDLSRIPDELAADLEESLTTAVSGGAVFPQGDEPYSIAQNVLSAAVREIETHPRGKLLQRFLMHGPQEDIVKSSKDAEERLSDAETAAAISFLYSHTVQTFQGALAELLATGPSMRLIEDLQEDGRVPEETKLFVGDAVLAGVSGRSGKLKAADLHMLVEDERSGTVSVVGVIEVKSFRRRWRRVGMQLADHKMRAAEGIRLRGVEYSTDRIRLGWNGGPCLTIRVIPDEWTLPRSFHFEESDGRTFLHVDPPIPPSKQDRIEPLGTDEWSITLRWSQEALAATALELAFSWMERFGEVLYADGVPPEWQEMTPAEAGQNSAKMMLYYSILRARTPREESRAIALYNSFGFGYALGMNFRDADGRRQMLWPEDLREILADGRTRKGYRIWGFS